MKPFSPSQASRRGFLKATTAFGLWGMANRTLSAPVSNGLASSDLVYLSPLKSNGKESRCQAEIWFAYDGVDIFVCTGTQSWRAQAVKKGLAVTRFWVGDLGQWRQTDGKYKALPSILAKGTVETSIVEQQRALELFGDKYRLSWIVWGPRFRKGLENGKRTMLRYRPMV